MSKKKDAKLFHCYVCRDIFKVATAKKVQEFDFSSFKNILEVIADIKSVIGI